MYFRYCTTVKKTKKALQLNYNLSGKQVFIISNTFIIHPVTR